ncbi:MAG: transketolase, partial [Candidatus Aminicenantaceae bacterium]
MGKNKDLNLIAKKLRIHSLKMTSKAGSGHPTTCMSMAEIAACLFFDEMQYNIKDPQDWGNDELVLSKGHAAPILWAAYAEAGIIPVSSLMNLRKITSVLEGHPTPRMKWVKAATGSLGQGLSVGVGMAAAQKLAGSRRRTYVVMGDGEMAEGSVWEAANTAANMELDNLTALVDINRLAQSAPTMHGHNLRAYERKFKAFGWDVFRVDGHKVAEIREALKKAR